MSVHESQGLNETNEPPMVKHPKSVGSKLLSGSVLRVASLMVGAITSFFLMPFVIHHFDDRTYGFWSLASAFIGYYSLLDLGLSSAVSQYLSTAIGRKDYGECRDVFNAAWRINCGLGAAALLVTAALVAATPWLSHSPADAHLFRNVLAILGVTAALGFPVRVYGAALEVQFRFDIASFLAIAGALLRTILIVWAVLAGGGLTALAWTTLLGSLPIMVLQIWFGRREARWARIKGSRWVDSKLTKKLFTYSLQTFLAYLADILRFQVDALVISGLIGLAAVTHYRVAEVFTRYFLQVLILAVGILQPVFSRLYASGNRTALESIFYFGTKLSSCISVFVCLAIVGWGKPFINRWMGARYEDGYLPLVVLSFAVLLDVCQKPSIDLLYATFKHRFYTYINWAEGAINLAFSLALARRFGITGVAIGTLVGAFVIRVLIQPWWVCKVCELNYRSYMGFLGRNMLFSFCLMGVATALSAWGLRPSYPFLASSAICATALYTLGSWALIFNRQDREWLLAALTNRVHKQSEPATAAV